jgi:uncharacterized membrane protein YtjA (UPF0391 family)
VISPQLAASLTLVVALSMLAGWVTAFRNRAYLGWLGLAFLSLSGYLIFRDRAATAHQLGMPSGGAALAATVLFAVAIGFFLVSLVAAAQETRRRLREVQASHRAAEEALLEMMRAGRGQEDRGDREDTPGPGSGET